MRALRIIWKRTRIATGVRVCVIDKEHLDKDLLPYDAFEDNQPFQSMHD